jgi:hypothetical protein
VSRSAATTVIAVLLSEISAFRDNHPLRRDENLEAYLSIWRKYVGLHVCTASMEPGMGTDALILATTKTIPRDQSLGQASYIDVPYFSSSSIRRAGADYA